MEKKLYAIAASSVWRKGFEARRELFVSCVAEASANDAHTRLGTFYLDQTLAFEDGEWDSPLFEIHMVPDERLTFYRSKLGQGEVPALKSLWICALFMPHEQKILIRDAITATEADARNAILGTMGNQTTLGKQYSLFAATRVTAKLLREAAGIDPTQKPYIASPPL